MTSCDWRMSVRVSVARAIAPCETRASHGKEKGERNRGEGKTLFLVYYFASARAEMFVG